jgi:hypothetical protein
MITPADALLLLETLAVAGIRAPDAYLRPAGDGLPSGKVLAAKVYAAALNGAGLDLRAAQAAIDAYLAEPDPGQYPKPWPDPGKLIARTAIGRAAGHLGSDADADRAFADFVARMQALAFRPDREDPSRRLDPADPYRDDAMFAALRAVGGPEGWRGAPTQAGDPIGFDRIRRAWLAAYRDTRAGQRRDVAALQVTARGQGLLGGTGKQIEVRS